MRTQQMGKRKHEYSETCKCWGCASKRGEYSGINAPAYKDGKSLGVYYCIDCGKQIGWHCWWYGSKKCKVCVNIGKKLSEEHKHKIAIGGRNNQFKKGHKTNIGKITWNKGKTYHISEEARLRNKNSPYYFQKGENHPLWKGGISPLNDLIRASIKFTIWRDNIYKRDSYRCIACGSNKDIEAHHKKALSIIIDEDNIKTLDDAYDCPRIWDETNGETRCYKCHLPTRVGLMKNLMILRGKSKKSLLQVI